MDIKRLVLVKFSRNHAPKGVFEISGGRVTGFGPRRINQLSGVIKELQQTGSLILN